MTTRPAGRLTGPGEGLESEPIASQVTPSVDIPLTTVPTAAPPAPLPATGDAFTEDEVTDIVDLTIDDDKILGLPPNTELWEVDGQLYAIVFVRDADPPIPLVWTVSDSAREAMEQARSTPLPIKLVTSAQFNAIGPLIQGPSSFLVDTPEDPFDAFMAWYEDATFIMPWLEDPEIMAVYAAAFLEGGEPSIAELAQTEWWQTHSQAERDWMVFSNADPISAGQTLDANRRAVRDLLIQSGVENPTESLIQYMADQVTTGFWTQALLSDQVAAISDPFSGIPIDNGLATYLQQNQISVDTTRDQEEVVRGLVNRWLGPHFASFWSDEAISRWAGEFRNDPDAETELLNILRGQRLTLFPAFTNENLTYEDIAAPARGIFFNVWGQQADETDPFFLKLLNLNDAESMQQILRQEGLSRGIRQVQNDALGSLVNAFGGSIVRADPAIL